MTWVYVHVQVVYFLNKRTVVKTVKRSSKRNKQSYASTTNMCFRTTTTRQVVTVITQNSKNYSQTCEQNQGHQRIP